MASTGDWGEAPPGVNLAESQDASLITAVAIMTVIGVAAVALRIFARVRCGADIAEDDYFIFLALLFAIGTAACCMLCVYYGGGKHLWSTTTEEFIKMFQITYAFVLIFATSVTMTKISILLYYRRLFGETWWHHSCMFLAVGYEVAVVIAWLAGVRPISYYWTQYTDPSKPGYSIDSAKFFLYNGICASVIDILILLVPFPTVWKLNMPSSKKIAVCGILLLGAFVCIAGIMRLIACDTLTASTDVTWAMGEVFIWSCCEPFIGILCASLPTFAPLFRRWRDRSTGSRSNKRSGNTSGRALEEATYKASATTASKMSANKPGRQWKRLQESDSSCHLRDDELELTAVSQPRTKDSDEHMEIGRDILVRKDISVVITPGMTD